MILKKIIKYLKNKNYLEIFYSTNNFIIKPTEISLNFLTILILAVFISLLPLILFESWKETTKALGWVGSSFIGGLITFYYAYYKDKKNDARRIYNEAKSVANSTSLFLCLQYSELSNIEIQLQEKRKLLQEIDPKKKIAAYYNFEFYKEIDINIEDLYKKILSIEKTLTPENQEKVNNVLRDIFISYKQYRRSLNVLEQFHDMKITLREEKNGLEILDGHLIKYIPEYYHQARHTKEFTAKTLEKFKAVLKLHFDIIVPIGIGPIEEIMFFKDDIKENVDEEIRCV